MFVSNASEPYCGEERSHNTDGERQGKTTDGTCTEVVEDNRSDDRREVRVENRREGVAITVSKCLFDVLASAEFFFRTFVNQYVCVHRHTQRQHHTCKTAQGQCSLERSEDTKGEEKVENERDVGHHTRDNAIECAHEDHQEHKCHYASGETCLNRCCTEAWSHCFFLYNVGGSRHLTTLEHVGQVLSLLSSEITADL